jgi:drug/metabolite transporter (DMT)-like permease
MSIWRISGILICVVLISIGQVLFKYSALRADPKGGIWALLLNPYLVSAGVIYAGATLLWVMQLRSVPLNRAYPLFALAFIMVPLLSNWIFGEKLSIPYILGSVVVVVGVILCTIYY